MDNTQLKEKILNIEDKIIFDDSKMFYKSFCYNYDTFDNIMKKGIKAPILTNNGGGGWNGKYYISLSKNLNLEKEQYKSAYSLLVDHNFMFIINDIKTIKAYNNLMYSIFSDTIIPLRPTEYDDEYQVFLKIKSSKILGIQYKLINNCSKIENLIELRNIIEHLKQLNIDIPIYDYSLEDSKRIVDKEKYLSLMSNIK